MNSLQPFIYWFGFEDNIDEQSDIHFYQTIILALSAEEALSWGDNLAKEFKEKGEAKNIHSSWIEDVIPVIITTEGTTPINWENVLHQEMEQYYQGTASSKDKSCKNINAFILSKNEKDAKNLWNSYLLENQLNYKFETCCKPSISITKVGVPVDWL